MSGSLVTLLVVISAAMVVGVGVAIVVTYDTEIEHEESYSVIVDDGITVISDSALYGNEHKFFRGEEFELNIDDVKCHATVVGATQSPEGTYVVDGSYDSVIIRQIYDGDTYRILLPEDQKGYSLSPDTYSVHEGGRCTLSYSLITGYSDENMVMTVNGNPVELDGTKNLRLTNITCDQRVSVTGIHDVREYTISVPETQVGYVLTSSVDHLYHGESYSLSYSLLPGYHQGEGFGIFVNGISPIVVSETTEVSAVQSNQNVTVVGVVPIDYTITAGLHTSLLVNGVVSPTATINDTITVAASEGYSIPEDYASFITGPISNISGGFKITGDAVFPSVVRITLGDNIQANGTHENGRFCICTSDVVTITAESGYMLPLDYNSHIVGGIAVTDGYTFANDVSLPSIFKVQYNPGNGDSSTVRYVVSGTVRADPAGPVREYYEFNGWSSGNSTITEDVTINALWDPCEYTVFVGINLYVTYIEHGNQGDIVKTAHFSSERVQNNENFVSVPSDVEFKVRELTGSLSLPANYMPNSNSVNYLRTDDYGAMIYNVHGDCSFPGLSTINYYDENLIDNEIVTAMIGYDYTLLSSPSWEKAGYVFDCWKINGVPAITVVDITESSYNFIASWRQST